jgi:hypothetical protein
VSTERNGYATSKIVRSAAVLSMMDSAVSDSGPQCVQAASKFTMSLLARACTALQIHEPPHLQRGQSHSRSGARSVLMEMMCSALVAWTFCTF